MSKIKMVLMLVLLLATVVTTAASFSSGGGLVAKAACPSSGESEGTCVPDENDSNFSSCSGNAQRIGNNAAVCSESTVCYEGPGGHSICGPGCSGGFCVLE